MSSTYKCCVCGEEVSKMFLHNCGGPSDVGGPTMQILTDQERKNTPVCTGVLDYFPLAIMEIARLSKAATAQHHPDKPMHWERAKSSNHADCLLRHMIDRGKFDTDGQRHTAKVAWRALALLQVELEQAAR